MTENASPLRWMIQIAGPIFSPFVAQHETKCGTKVGTEQISHQEETERAQKIFPCGVEMEKAIKTITDTNYSF